MKHAAYALLGVVWLAAGCSSSTPDDGAPKDANAPAAEAAAAALVSDRYLDDAECIRCHRAEARGYERSGMSRTFGPPTPDRMFEDWDHAHYYHPPSDRHYEMFRDDDGRYAIHRYQEDADGQRYNEITQVVEWVIGSGTHSRTYLYRNPAGELHQFPVAWYAETSRWGIHGGFDLPVHDGFDRRITRDCVGCHDAYADIPVDHDKLGWPNLFPDDLPHGIGCQRCHGPGGEHVRIADDDASSDAAVMASIFNPATAAAPVGEDTCMQCHLLPASRLASRLMRFGHGTMSYDAGKPLADAVVHLAMGDENEQRARFEANHHPCRLRFSRCWIESEGALTCFSCHRVHARPEPEARSAWYRDRCLECHESHDAIPVTARPTYLADTPDDGCVACHMPRRRATDLTGEVVHDHLVMRFAPDQDPTRPIAERAPDPGDPSMYLPERAPDEPERAMQLAIARLHGGDPAAIDALLALVDEHQPTTVEPYAYLGPALVTAGRPADAERILARALVVDEKLPIAHFELGRLLIGAGRVDEGRQHLERALELEPRFPEALVGLAAVAAGRGSAPEARRYLDAALALRPIDADTHRLFANLFTSLGDAPRTAQALTRMLAVAPGTVDAYLQLGTVLMFGRQSADADRWFQRGLRQAPGDVRLHEARATLLVTTHRFREALELAATARDLAGSDEATWFMIEALAYRGLGEDDRAESAREQALSVRAGPSLSPIRRFLRDSMAQW